MAQIDTLLPPEGGVAWVFRRISRGRSPREILRKTQATPTSGGRSNILYLDSSTQYPQDRERRINPSLQKRERRTNPSLQEREGLVNPSLSSKSSTVLYHIVLYSTLLYCIVPYCTVLHCTVLYHTVLYCTVLYCVLL